MKTKTTNHLGVSPNLVRVAVAAAIAGVPLWVPHAANAQEAPPQGEQLEEVLVTGSRILRRDLITNSPLVSVDTEQFENRTGLNIESYLNQMPNYNPAAAPTVATGPGSNSDVQISAVNSVGIASVSLRGFGPNRNLVLVNGKRPTPINALMVTDLNGIPSALVERTEIISGGASAVYGADAIGGVTNFILRDDFEGFEFDIQGVLGEAGDGEETRAYAIMGTPVSEGRGNITFGAEYYNREAALEKEREFYTKAWADPTVGSDFFVFGYNGYSSGFAPPNPAALNAVLRPPAGTGVQALGPGFLQGFRFNQDQSLFTLQGNNLARFLQHGGVIDGREYALQRTYDTTTAQQGIEIDTLKWNNEQALVSAPQERYSLFASGTFELAESVTFFSRATWAESKTRTLLLPTNASFGWEAQIPYNPTTDSPVNPALNYTDPTVLANVVANPAAFANPSFIATGQPGAQHPVPVDLAVLLNSRANPAGTWIMETYPADSFDQRATHNTNTVWQIETGVNFELPLGDWTGELYYSHGESSTYNIAFGNNSLTRWRTLVTAADYGRNARISGNQNGASPGFGAADITCASGFYDMIFRGDISASEDCKFAVQATLQTRTQNKQDIVELNFQGGLFDLPAGELRSAVGAQYRRNGAEFFPDILQSTASFTDQVIGVYPTGYLDASTSVKDYYLELLVPILSDLKFLKRLELELGGRYSDYADTESTTTFKITGNAQVNDWLRFRGGYNKATRAPNLGELFLNTQEIFTIGGANFGDPCGLRSTAPYGAGGVAADPVLTPGEPQTQLAAGQTAAGAQSAYLICQAQMGAAAAATFYSQNATGNTGSVFNWVLQQGNPNLDSETADTYTAGVVFTSPSDSPWLSGFSAAIDWWKVDIEDAIQNYSVDYARFLCYGAVTVTSAAAAAAQAASPACQSVSRNTASGAANTILIQYDNQATIATSGIDVQLNWFAQFADLGFGRLPGGLGLNIQATWLDYYETKQSPAAFDVETDWVGSLGPNLTGTNAGAYRYRMFSSLSYSLPSLSVNLRWRHLPSVRPATAAAEDAIIRNNERVAAGGGGVLLSYTPGTAIATKSYDVIDLSLNWNITDRLSLRAGVDNVFDWDPRLLGDNGTAAAPTNPIGARRGYPTGTNLSAVCSAADEAKGCVDPTNFVAPSSGAGFTNGGYYDTLGRRYFVGMKMQF
jgi:iron complex outermembrane recepter protein